MLRVSARAPETWATQLHVPIIARINDGGVNTQCPVYHAGVKIASWNVNGIRSVLKKGMFAPFVRALEPDVICLQETKAAEGQCDPGLPEYHQYWNAAEKKGYSGTAIFSKVAPLSVAYDLPDDLAESFELAGDGYGNPNREGRVIAAEFDPCFVMSVYTPNAKDDLSRLPLRHSKWDPAFLSYCKRLEQHKPVVFCGDLNVAHTPDDLTNAKANEGRKGFTAAERAGIDAVIEGGFVDSFRAFTKGGGHYTWWSPFSGARERNVGWRIDYIFVSDDLAAHLTGAYIHSDILGSDHCPVSVRLDIDL